MCHHLSLLLDSPRTPDRPESSFWPHDHTSSWRRSRSRTE